MATARTEWLRRYARLRRWSQYHSRKRMGSAGDLLLKGTSLSHPLTRMVLTSDMAMALIFQGVLDQLAGLRFSGLA